MAQLIQFTLCHGPTVQIEMSLVTAGIHCTISERLSGSIRIWEPAFHVKCQKRILVANL